jgi:hemolysin III
MDFLNPREPISAWSHGLWLLLAIPGVVLLWRRSAGDRAKRISLAIYGASLLFCASASTLYHGVRVPRNRIEAFARLDYIGIYLFIAGSYTPIAWNLLRGRWRWGILALVWSWAALGAGLRVARVALPHELSTGSYLAMGWCAVFCYSEVARLLSHRALLPVLLGGILYSIGAILNLLQQPALWPGVFQAHELFHLLVIAGSLAHFQFMLKVIVPFAPNPALRSPPASRRSPRPARTEPKRRLPPRVQVEGISSLI